MEVCIEKTEQGQYFVYEENKEPSQGMNEMPEASGMESEEPANKQPARSLQDALMMAGKMLSQAPDAGQQAFDAGMQRVLPNRGM